MGKAPGSTFTALKRELTGVLIENTAFTFRVSWAQVKKHVFGMISCPRRQNNQINRANL